MVQVQLRPPPLARADVTSEARLFQRKRAKVNKAPRLDVTIVSAAAVVSSQTDSSFDFPMFDNAPVFENVLRRTLRRKPKEQTKKNIFLNRHRGDAFNTEGNIGLFFTAKAN
ncbi:hypothetical protein F2P81_008403 [Scophthalmus maximus]|uniref:Uncharacterized protein n=1 Tax=Scophthalmus maximus TaxID=52904 RepID=A0A6A4T770_SCOMX|nr:hypothetical protein F2P81_008403 [Scophthalmus maximus]